MYVREFRLSSEITTNQIIDLEEIAVKADKQFVGLVINPAEFDNEIKIKFGWKDKPIQINDIVKNVNNYLTNENLVR